jgi:3-oxoacyl-[acyl-carrier-protein] synthase-1
MPALAIRAYTATTALGRGRDALTEALRSRRSGLRRNDFGGDQRLDCWIGRVDGLEQSPLPSALSDWECRNNRLAWMSLQQDGLQEAVAEAIARHGADRVAVVMGTSTSSIGATEEAYALLAC